MGPCKCAPKLPDSCWMTCEAKNETLGNLPDTQPLQAIWQLSFMHFYCPNSTKTVINQQFHKFCLICSFGVLGPFLPTFAMRIYCGKKHENNNTTCSLLFCSFVKKSGFMENKNCSPNTPNSTSCFPQRNENEKSFNSQYFRILLATPTEPSWFYLNPSISLLGRVCISREIYVTFITIWMNCVHIVRIGICHTCSPNASDRIGCNSGGKYRSLDKIASAHVKNIGGRLLLVHSSKA